MRQLLFIAGPTAIGKKTLADHLARDAGHCVREMLGIDGPVEKLGYPKGPDELYFGADVDTGLVMWQGAADSLIEQVGEQFPSVSRRIVSIWRPFDSHWRDYRDKTILYGAGLHRDAHAADWMELCLTHRRSIYHKLALHRGVEQVI
ncbi:MAG TPA: hypothetical protein VFU48_14170, partial [Nitrospira sp.]|nr:hypothetical protein [Nitrospira sp.]